MTRLVIAGLVHTALLLASPISAGPALDMCLKLPRSVDEADRTKCVEAARYTEKCAKRLAKSGADQIAAHLWVLMLSHESRQKHAAVKRCAGLN